MQQIVPNKIFRFMNFLLILMSPGFAVRQTPLLSFLANRVPLRQVLQMRDLPDGHLSIPGSIVLQ